MVNPYLKAVTKGFYARFGDVPDLVVRAPGRVNLIGEHTDYNDGLVMPIAVNVAVWLAASPNQEEWAILRARDMGNAEAIFPTDRVPASAGGWEDYPKSVIWAFLEEELTPVSINAVFTSEVPVGAGLASSAAVEVAFAYAWDQLSGFDLSREKLARLSHRAENGYVGIECGITDQMASACSRAGYAMLLDTRSSERGYFSMPPGVVLAVVDSGVRRSLANSAYNTRRSQCEQAFQELRNYLPDITSLRDVRISELKKYGRHLSDVLYQRARHVVHENLRVVRMAKALQGRDLETVGEILVEGHRSLREDFEVSTPELDTLVEAATEVPGCYGARMTGAGFGGCIMALVAEDAATDLRRHLDEVYDERFDRQPTTHFMHATDGVRTIELPT